MSVRKQTPIRDRDDRRNQGTVSPCRDIAPRASGSLFDELLPELVSVADMDPEVADVKWLTPGEFACVQRAIPARQREFAAGRALARKLLWERHRQRCGELQRRPDGAPSWPDGYIGSITHCRDLVAVAVSSQADVLALGIDVEPWEPLPIEMDGLLLHPDEARWLASEPEEETPYLRRLLFSAKESTYKALHQVAGVDFVLREVAIQVSGTHFIATVCGRAGETTVTGKWAEDGRHVATATILLASGQIDQPARP